MAQHKVVLKYAAHMQVDPASVSCTTPDGRALPLSESPYELDLDDRAVVLCVVND